MKRTGKLKEITTHNSAGNWIEKVHYKLNITT